MIVLALLIVLGPFVWLYFQPGKERAAWAWLGWSGLALFVAWVALIVYVLTKDPYS